MGWDSRKVDKTKSQLGFLMFVLSLFMFGNGVVLASKKELKLRFAFPGQYRIG